ncbi:putative oxidoreductase-like protein [Leptotrombidium deliense]|uniref:Putative oxidoreductase-like protein n=1 Tax=Leptotrombidium deliense TaxID=299467 RepID=A0A443SGU8_9ACAR|nr:putative oxidoreductase-like protein [Leptotrombidium deliense]
MGGSKAPLSITDSISNMIRTIEKVDESVNGLMLNYDGNVIPW